MEGVQNDEQIICGRLLELSVQSSGKLRMQDVRDVIEDNGRPEVDIDVIKDFLRSNDVQILDEADDEAEESVSAINPISAYMVSISKIPLLTAEEEIELARKIAGGDIDAKKRLVEANLRLVVSIASKYKWSKVQFSDLIQEGNMALIKAAAGFDPDKGNRFSTYATACITRAITDMITEKTCVLHISKDMARKIKNVNKERKRLTEENNREPTETELAESLGVSVNEVREVVRVTQSSQSLDAPMGEEDSKLADFIPDNETAAPYEKACDALLKQALWEALDDLSEREREVIILRFGLNGGNESSVEYVAERFQITCKRARHIETKALSKLRHPTRSRRLKEFLE